MSEICYRINSPSVIYERFDDELVAIHLERGSYHSMAGAGTEAFLLLAGEATLTELAQTMTAKYTASPAELAAGLAPFLEQLEKEQLIVRVETRTAQESAKLDDTGNKLAFAAPSLQAFHDLEGLLLLDPIHEVGEQGWPQPQLGN